MCKAALLLVFCACMWAADVSQLRDLAGKHRFFELRRALEQPGWSGAEMGFYRGMVASRFGHEAEGAALLRSFLATRPAPEQALQAWEEIESGAQRLGHYKEAAEALDEALKLMTTDDPDREETENTRVLMESLSDVAPPTADFGDGVPAHAVRNKLGTWNVPVRINGVEGDWIFDTGANMSTVTESEAKRMGLVVRQSKAWVGGSTAKRNALEVTVAGDLRFGASHIHNVVFLVLADQALHIGPLHYQITGILGLPVLRALGRVGISADGRVRIRPGDWQTTGAPDLYFEELATVTEVAHVGHFQQMHLDTGANDTTLYAGFRDALSPDEKTRIRRKSEQVGGAGGVIRRKTEFMPEVHLDLAGKTIALKKLSLLSEPAPGKFQYFDGVIGMDALWGGFLLDFGAMRLDLQ